MGRRSKKPATDTRPVLLHHEILPRAPVQVCSKANRERIRDAALECFREHGYAATSIDAIADRARVAVGGVYLHFKSKRQLLLVLMDELLESLAAVQLTIQAEHPREAIRALLRDAFNRDLKFLGAYRAWREAVPTDRALAELDATIRAWTRQRVVDLFAVLKRMPGARRDVDVERLGALMDRVFWTLLADALGPDSNELRRSIDVATDVTYHALFEDEGGRKGRR